MPLDTETYLDRLELQIAKHPKRQALRDALRPYVSKLRDAERDGRKDIVVLVYLDIKIALNAVLFPKGTPINPNTDIRLLAGSELEVQNWIYDQVNLRLETLNYFEFNNLLSIDGVQYPPPSPEVVYNCMKADADILRLMNSFVSPLLIMTPIGVSMTELVDTFTGVQGAMQEQQIAPYNQWGNNESISFNFDDDIEGNILYGYALKTKRQVLAERSQFKGWQVLVVEGTNRVGNKNRTAVDAIDADRKNGFVGLTPEDELMLQAEGIRMGRPFDTDVRAQLTGASFLTPGGKIPTSLYVNSQVTFGMADRNYNDPRLGSRRAVKIL